MITRFAVAVLFLGLNLYVFRYLATAEFVPERESFATFPLEIGDWRCDESAELAENVTRNLGVTDYLLCDYRSPEARSIVNVYVGYHASQTRNAAGKETLIHPPEHCLPGSGWDIIRSDIVPAPWAPGGEAKRVVIARGNQRNLVYFWYQTRGRVIARNHEKVLYMFLDRATERRTDGALVRFTTSIRNGDERTAERKLLEFASSMAPLLPGYLPE